VTERVQQEDGGSVPRVGSPNSGDVAVRLISHGKRSGLSYKVPVCFVLLMG
jgi:hypothetical protein